MEEQSSQRWYNFYEAIFGREFDRLDTIIEKIKRKEKSTEISFYLAEAKAKQLLTEMYLTTDFWIEDLVEERDLIPKIDTLKHTLEAISRYGGRGDLKRNLPPSWIDMLNESFKKLAGNFEKFSRYTKEFAQYIEGWSGIKLKNQPHIEVANNLEAEAYALLFGFHGSVADITDLEHEGYLERIKNGEYMLPGMLTVYREITSPIYIIQFLDPHDLQIFLKKYLAKDEYEWENVIFPQLESGLNILGQFLRRKGGKLVKIPATAKLHVEKIMESWIKDVKEENVRALERFAYNKKARESLASKFEYGVEPKLE